VTLAFDLPGATRVSEVLGAGDSRELALAFSRVRIMPLLEHCQSPNREPVSIAVAGTTAAEAVGTAEQETGVKLHDLLTRFEIICGDCAFGLTQRALGSDPLSLLRFAGATPRVTIHGLETEFRELGETLSTVPAGDGTDEWMVADSAGLHYHSGKSLSIGRDDVIRGEQKKIAFLREKLLRDLTEARKVFLFADCFRQPPEAAMSIFLALRRVSGACLLWLRETPFGEQPGSAKEIAPGLVMGFVDFHGNPTVDGMPVGGWIAVLASAHVLIEQSYPSPHFVGF
jgi:hypothetical protein